MALRWLIVALILGLIVEFSFGYVRSHPTMSRSCGGGPFGDLGLRFSNGGPRTMNLLFVGNSLTDAHDLPGAIVKVANSDRQNPVKLAVGSSTQAGASLQDLYNDGCALKRIRATHFDAVVLQEHTYFWTTPAEAAEARTGLGSWAVAAGQSGSAPIYFEPWLFAGDSSNVGNLRDATTAETDAFAIPVVRVGEAFAQASNTPTAPDLYEGDRHHASSAGSYFTALIFFHHFTGEPAERAVWRPDEVTAAQATVLAGIADEY